MDTDNTARRKPPKQATEATTTQLKLQLSDKIPLDYDSLKAAYVNLLQEVETLRATIEQLQSGSSPRQVAESKEIYQPTAKSKVIQPTEVNSRLTLFRSLFGGREDVYAQRWEKADGSSNYSPAKHHDWDSHTKSDKGKMICGAACQLLPLTDRVLDEHLNGQRTIGIYPLLKDETCRLLAADFDEANWQDDVLAFLDTCDRLGVPGYLERSRSGNGAHVWIFFDKPVRAYQARSLGSFLVSETKQNRYQLAFKSYDRLFPNQDTMPKGGFGNLIALPLQLTTSKAGNSVFVDRNFQPFEDQWTYLSAVKRMRSVDLDSIVREASAREAIVTAPLSSDDEGSDEPWKQKPSGKRPDAKLKEPFPKKLSIVLGNMVYLPKAGFGSPALNKILNLAAFQNPEFYQKQATRQSTHDTPRVICCADDLPQHIALPRGCVADLKHLLQENDIAVDEIDERDSGEAIEVNFKGTLREEQGKAAQAILSADLGILSASTAFGKTVVATHIIAERKVNTLILVHTVQLIDQWRERLAQFLDIPSSKIGQLGGGKKKSTGLIDVATIQTLGRRGEVSDIVAEYGQVIVDECHHISAFTFEQVVKQTKAKYILGLTATPVRKDGHQPIIMMQCGPIRFKDAKRNRQLLSGVKHVVVPRETGFQTQLSVEDVNFSELYDALVADEKRNDLIFDDILKALEKGRSPLVLTERLNHLDALAEKLTGFAKNVIVLKGGMTKKQRTAIFAKLQAIPDNEERIILSTGKYIGEGFDDPRLDTLFLLLPISFEGRVEQYAGRLHREREGKTEVRIYDYVDSSHPALRSMYKNRCIKYRQLGYETEMV
jgi:superfamily II DNA or RNA helicase